MLGRRVREDLEGDAGAPQDVDGGRPVGRHGSDASDFGYAPGGPAIASIDVPGDRLPSRS